MPRYKPYDYNQGQFIPIQFEKQIQPGSFENALDFIVDHKLNISTFEKRIKNDEAGAPAYDPNEPFEMEMGAEWESGELLTFNNAVSVPATSVEVGHTYRARVRMQDDTGRWSHRGHAAEISTVGRQEFRRKRRGSPSHCGAQGRPLGQNRCSVGPTPWNRFESTVSRS